MYLYNRKEMGNSRNGRENEEFLQLVLKFEFELLIYDQNYQKTV